jgi:flavin-dependent dehydrogenase
MTAWTADALVIGAGPAGSATAIALLQIGRSVILAERGAVTGRPGEGLPGAARCELAALGLWDDFLAQQHGSVWSMNSAWGSEHLASQDLAFHPYGQNWHLDREIFDALCRGRAADRGALLLQGAVTGARFAGGKWRTTIAGGEPAEVSVRFVVDATGRASAFARGQGASRRKRDRLVGLASTFAGRLPHTALFSTLIEATAEGWWYAAQMPHGRTSAVYMTDADALPGGRERLAEFWNRQLCLTSHIKTIASPADPVEVTAWPAESAALDQVHGPGWLAVGDAACAFDPLSSLGIRHSLESGRWAASAVDEALRGKPNALGLYRARIDARIREFEHLKGAYYGAERRWKQNRFWTRRHAAADPMTGQRRN